MKKLLTFNFSLLCLGLLASLLNLGSAAATPGYDVLPMPDSIYIEIQNSAFESNTLTPLPGQDNDDIYPVREQIDSSYSDNGFNNNLLNSDILYTEYSDNDTVLRIYNVSNPSGATPLATYEWNSSAELYELDDRSNEVYLSYSACTIPFEFVPVTPNSPVEAGGLLDTRSSSRAVGAPYLVGVPPGSAGCSAVVEVEGESLYVNALYIISITVAATATIITPTNALIIVLRASAVLCGSPSLSTYLKPPTTINMTTIIPASLLKIARIFVAIIRAGFWVSLADLKSSLTILMSHVASFTSPRYQVGKPKKLLPRLHELDSAPELLSAVNTHTEPSSSWPVGHSQPPSLS